MRDTHAIGLCKRKDVENVFLPAWLWLNSRERQVSPWCLAYWLWKFLPLSSGTSRLSSSQPLIIFFPPNSNVLSFPLPGFLCVYVRSPPFFPLIAFSFSLLWEGGRKDKGGRRRRKGLKMQIQVRGSFLWQIRPHYTHLSFAIGSAWSPLLFRWLACLHYIMKFFTSLSRTGETLRTARWPKGNLWLLGTRSALQMKQDRAGEVGGIVFMSVVRTVQHFFALALCQQPTPLSLSPSWELLPPSRSDRERLKTKEEKYRRPLGLLSLLKQDIV